MNVVEDGGMEANAIDGRDVDVELTALLELSRRADWTFGARQAAWYGAGVVIALAGPLGLALAPIGLASVELVRARRGGAARARLVEAGVSQPIVRLSSPIRSARANRIVGGISVVLGLLFMVASIAAMTWPAFGNEVGGWTAGPGLTSDGDADVVWYRDPIDPASRRDHPPARAIAYELSFPLVLLWMAALILRRRRMRNVSLRDPDELQRLVERCGTDPVIGPFLAAELVLAKPDADDAVEFAARVRLRHGDLFLPAWVRAMALLRVPDLAAAKAVLSSTYAAITDPRRILVADALAATWEAAGDAAMAAAHRANASRLAKREFIRQAPSRSILGLERSDATLVTDELDREVSKNRA